MTLTGLPQRPALVHKVLLNHGSEKLSKTQRLTWSRFILAQLFRVPASIDWLRSFGRQLLLEQFESMAKMAGQPQAMDVWSDPGHADTLDDEGLKVLNRAIESAELNKLILDGVWSIIESNCDVDAVLSDTPVSHIGQLMENSFVLVLPISPTKIFVCASTVEDIDMLSRQPAKNLMKAINRQFAKQFVDPVRSGRIYCGHFASLRAHHRASHSL